MKRTSLIIALVAALFAFPASAVASPSFDRQVSRMCQISPRVCNRVQSVVRRVRHAREARIENRRHRDRLGAVRSTAIKSVPEIDAAGGAIALSLLVGCIGIRRELKARKAGQL